MHLMCDDACGVSLCRKGVVRSAVAVHGWVGSAADVMNTSVGGGVVMHARGAVQSDGAIFNQSTSLFVQGIFGPPSGATGQEIQSTLTLTDNVQCNWCCR